MIYFSELKGRKVVIDDAIEAGVVEDLIFLASGNPKITKIVVRGKAKNQMIIPIEHLKKINSSLLIDKNYITTELVENELFLVKNLLDKQIIDLVGHKVVRVNDVVIQEKPVLYIAGVDIGLIGMLRWLKIEEPIFKLLNRFDIKPTSRFLPWTEIQPLELARGEVRLKKEKEKLENVRPEDLADYLEKTNIVNVRKFLKILDEDLAAEVIGNLNITFQQALFSSFKPQKAAGIVNLIDPDEAVDILLTLPLKKREQILKLTDDKKRKQINHLFGLAKTQLGHLVTTQYFTADSNLTVREIFEKIRKETADFPCLQYVYFINQQGQLVGVANLYELLMQNPDASVYKFMTQNIMAIHISTPIEIAVKKILKYRLMALPVIDKDRKMLGIVTFDDLAEFIINFLP